MGKSIMRVEIDSNALKKLTTELKEIEPGLARQLTKDIKNEMLPVASKIQLVMPTSAPLSGMQYEGRLGFERVKVGAAAVPGARWGKPFAKFTVAGAGEALAALIEGAGTETNGKTASGKNLINVLDSRAPKASPKAGRYFFKGYLNNKAGLLNRIQKILDRYTDTVNRKLN